MNRFATITRNVSVMSVGMILNKLSGAFITIALARFTGQAGVGLYAFANSFTAMFSVIPELGINFLLIRSVAEDRAQLSKYLGNVVVLRTLLALIAFLLTGIGIEIARYYGRLESTSALIVWLTAGVVFFVAAGSSVRWAFQAEEKLQYESLLTGGESVVLMAGWMLILAQGAGLLEVTVFRLAVSVLVCGAGFFLTIRRIARFALELDRTFCRRLLASALPFIGMLVFSRLYFNLDTVLLKFLVGDAATGQYSVAYRFITMLQMIQTVFQFSVMPAIMNASAGPSAEFVRIAQRAFRYMIIAGLGMGVITTVYADSIVRLLYGGNYQEAVLPLQILAWMLFCSYVTTVSNAVVVAHHREQRVMYITALGLLINVTSNLFLIPRWGAVGAAIAILSSEGAIFLAMLYQTGRCRPEIRMGALFGRPLAAAAAALFPIYALRDWNLFLGGAAAGIVYAIALVITRAIPSADRQLALSLFQRRRELP